MVLITGFPSEETYAEAFELGAARVQNVLGVPGWTKPLA